MAESITIGPPEGAPSAAQHSTFQPAPQEILRLRERIGRVQRARGDAILVDPEGAVLPVRVSPIGNELLPVLVEGASLEQLAERLHARYPKARDVEAKLRQFLDQLNVAGMLETSPPRERRPHTRWQLFNPDPLARRMARLLNRLPSWLAHGLLLALLGAATLGLFLVVQGSLRPHPAELIRRFNLLGLLAFVVVVAPLHELCHAIACRAAGAPVSAAGLIFHGGLIPGPYVDTTQAYQVKERSKRFWIPAAGPLVDYLACGAAAWLDVATQGHGMVGGAAHYLLLLCALFCYLDTNPLTPSDGSHMIEALLDDEMARKTALSRRRARLAPFKVKMLYRAACFVHLAAAGLVLRWLW